jgi:hypothetical protein
MHVVYVTGFNIVLDGFMLQKLDVQALVRSGIRVVAIAVHARRPIFLLSVTVS